MAVVRMRKEANALARDLMMYEMRLRSFYYEARTSASDVSIEAAQVLRSCQESYAQLIEVLQDISRDDLN
jgi:hypothetical protein